MDTQYDDLSLKQHHSSDEISGQELSSVREEVSEDNELIADRFTQQFESLLSTKEQLELCLDWMEQLLQKAQSTNLKLFWSVRKKATALFPSLEDNDFRSSCWQRYTELTGAARQIKHYQSEEDSFVVNQIELAISCLERDIETFCRGQETPVEKIEGKHFLNITSLSQRGLFYHKAHSDLAWLNSFSTRIIELRKELMRVGMRMKLKSQFFQRLSSSGNIVFPKRKEYISTVSKAFLEDVSLFVNTHFVRGDKTALKRSIFFLKQEIKNLQQAAKGLSVTSSVFSDTRAQLSKCWDQLRGLEDEVRKEQNRLREQSADSVTLIRDSLSKVHDLFNADTSTEGLRQALTQIAKQIKSSSLIHEDVLALRKELKTLWDQLKEKQDFEDKMLQEKKNKESEAKKALLTDLEHRIDIFVEECKDKKISSKDQYLELQTALAKLTFVSGSQKVALYNRLALGLKYINELREEQILASSEHSEKLIAMKYILSQRLERRKELKEKLEKDKQLLGGSCLDFESALQLSVIVKEDKQAIEEIDAKILEIKQEIQSLL